MAPLSQNMNTMWCLTNGMYLYKKSLYDHRFHPQICGVIVDWMFRVCFCCSCLCIQWQADIPWWDRVKSSQHPTPTFITARLRGAPRARRQINFHSCSFCAIYMFFSLKLIVSTPLCPGYDFCRFLKRPQTDATNCYISLFDLSKVDICWKI